jgi:putative nucleotidyltransferase with HDIG domain
MNLPPSDTQGLIRHPAVDRAAAALRAAGVGEAYLVGGTVRDWLLGRGDAARDLDVAIPAGARAAAEGAARALDGTVVPLDDATVRVVFAGPGGPWRLDVAAFRGPGIREDLALRDFTVDAMGVALLGREPAALLDPTGGRADLEARMIRHAYAAAFADDPLRTLRAVRLAAQLHGAIAPDTRPLIRQGAAGLARTAGERIRDEVIKIFGAPAAARWARELDDLGLLEVLVPEAGAMKGVPPSPPHRLGLWEHSLETLRLAEAVWADPAGWFPEDAVEVARRGDDVLEGEVTRRSLAALFALLHDVGKPATRSVDGEGRVRFVGHAEAGAAILEGLAARLRLGRRAAGFLDRMERGHMRPILLAAEPALTPRARYRFFRDLWEVALDLLVHSVADVGATGGVGGPAWEAHLRFVREMLAFRRECVRRVQEAPPLSGDEVMALTGIGPGPLVGHVLERVAEEAALGQIRSRGECLEMVRREFARWRREFEAAPDAASSPPKTP